MSDASEILKSVHLGLDVTIFLLNTDRGPQATKLCNECAILLQNLDSGIHLDISDALFNAYYAISACIKSAERNAKKLLCKFHLAGRLTIQLGDKYKAQRRFVEAKQLFKSVLTIRQMICCKSRELVAHHRIGQVCFSLSEMQKAIKHHQKALAIAIEIGDRQEERRINGTLGFVFYSLCKYQKAKEYQEKALAIAIEIGDRKGEGRIISDLGSVFYSLGEYQKAKEYQKKALAIAIEVGDRQQEGRIYGNHGTVLSSLGEYQKAKEHQEKALAIALETGDRQEEGGTYGKLGSLSEYLGEYQQAKEYQEKALAIAIEIADRKEEGRINGNLGSVFLYLGKYQEAKEYCEKALAIAIEIADREEERRMNGRLGCVFYSIAEYQKAIEYQEKALAIAIETGDRRGEGRMYGHLELVFSSLGNDQKAKEYCEKALAIAIEIGDREEQGKEYYSLGCSYFDYGKNREAKQYFEKAVGVSIAIGDRELEALATSSLAVVFASVNDFQKAKEHCEKALTINRGNGHRATEATIYKEVGTAYGSLGERGKAEDCLKKACSISSQIGDKMNEFRSLLCIAQLKLSHSEVGEAMDYLILCIRKYDQMRTFLKGNSEFKMSQFEAYGAFPYQLLTYLLCVTGNFRDALYAEELGRARVLAELIADKYSVESHISANPHSWFGIKKIVEKESNSVFLYISYRELQVFLWVLKANGDTFFRKTDEVKLHTLDAEQVCDVEGIFKKSAAGFGVLPNANCEDRSLDDNLATSVYIKNRTNFRGEQTKDTERIHHLCYEWIVAPVADLLTEPEIIIVPDTFSYRVPFAALRAGSVGKYLSEKYRIRVIPSLTTLQHIQEYPVDYHSQTGALVVGDPKVGKVYYNGLLVDITPLFFANKEVRMIGQLLGIPPLLGGCATKQAVLQAIPSVSLIHLAAHGNADRGEIALSPQSTVNSIPQEEDYLLTMSDIQGVQVRAKLVVLSCCHSGRGRVKKEGVIGIARAFLASGARSVLVASWAIDDQATANLMKHFYKHLVRGESASESLQQAVQWLRCNGFPKPFQWAPFVLMGDNVTFDFVKKGKEELKEDNKEAKKGTE